MIFVTNDGQMGKNIRYLRQKENMSPGVFSWLMNIDCETLEAIENGHLMEIDAQVLMYISGYFDVELRALVEDSLQETWMFEP